MSTKNVPAEEVKDVEVKEVEVKAKKETAMDKFLNDSAVPPTVGDLVEGKVIAIDKSAGPLGRC
jgi:hypothetical protein